MNELDGPKVQLAVALLKQGHGEEAVVVRLVQLGVDAADAAACVQHLAAMKRQADFAERLRADAVSLLASGKSEAEVAAHFAAQGIDDAAARAEARAIAAAFARDRAERAQMIPCDRCTRPMLPRDSFFAPSGDRICRACHSGDALTVAAERAYEAEREAIAASNLGMGLLAGVTALSGGVGVAVTRKPPERVWCDACHAYGAHIVEGRYRCSKCGRVCD